MDKLEPGDVVVYVYRLKPEWHGTVAIVKSQADDAYHSVRMSAYLLQAPGFAYDNTFHGPWVREAWEKIGHIEPGEVPDGA